MSIFVTAHRGDTSAEPEHTLAAYQAAVARGADAVEMCVRLSADGVPVVRRYAYLDDDTDLTGPVHARPWAGLAEARVGAQCRPLSTLGEVIAALDGRVDMEVQLKSLEPELVTAVAEALQGAAMDRVQVTSYEPALLALMAETEPDIIRCLLIGPTPSWADLDVLAHDAVCRARLARADGVHLHPSQCLPQVLHHVDRHSLVVHVWDADDPVEVTALHELGLQRFCTNRLDALLALRDA